MKILVKHIAEKLEIFAPIEYAESYDKIGLIVGSYDQEVKKIMITLDLTEEVFSESMDKKCNLIISFHPILFKPIKSLIGNNYSERVLISALKNNISVYVIHTNLDVIWDGTHSYISKLLKLTKEEVLFPKEGSIKKLTTYVPYSYSEKVRNALFNAGAGNISNYSHCSYNVDGYGTFMGNDKTKPFLGKKGYFHMEKEMCINVIFPTHKLHSIKHALFNSHPYEEVSYEIYKIENINPYLGIGRIGLLEEEMNEYDFLHYLKRKMSLSCMRHSIFTGKNIKNVSIIAGSGSFGIEKSIEMKADVFISSDFKYHDFFKSNQQILIVDIGHYESEKSNKYLLKYFLDKKFIHIPIYESEIDTNPVKYFF
ncbi:Nif3-like dinuclear metal center hexameric protein [Blattabacterium cuenoti]|uniref:Nif3-like dinuclear metal center hexameric protein n=1 Tax=Blattabacterium cuenoti TaxID=1653831 RepID=UPI00163C8379|nr:Nif3-like dinuclear metal center hexameric protein [Blattabacterium cuenoti]